YTLSQFPSLCSKCWALIEQVCSRLDIAGFTVPTDVAVVLPNLVLQVLTREGMTACHLPKDSCVSFGLLSYGGVHRFLPTPEELLPPPPANELLPALCRRFADLS